MGKNPVEVPHIFWGLICHCFNFLSFFFCLFFSGGVSVGYGRDASCMSRETSSCDETSRVSKQKRIQGMSSNIHPIFQSRELIPIALRSYKERLNLHACTKSSQGMERGSSDLRIIYRLQGL